ncbi:MAG: ABC transporter permease subunit [Legionellaceae bacterium]|nr:ABC transporter permease subunit [Legionellaceae bacterium]
MNKLLPKAYLYFIFALLYIPIVVLVFYSFNDARYSLVWHGPTLHWYRELLHDGDLWRAFYRSIVLAMSAAAVATTLGLLTAIHLFLWRHSKRRNLYALLYLLIVIPDIVLGVALLVFFNFSGIPLGFISLLIAHITFCLPFVILTINSRIHSLDPNVYFSALDLGATKATALRKIMLPLLWPAVVSAFLLCFTLSFDDVIISYFVAGPEYTILPLAIYSLVRTGVTPELNALCSFTILLSMLLVMVSHKISRQKP